jgi:hypothetical protein
MSPVDPDLPPRPPEADAMPRVRMSPGRKAALLSRVQASAAVGLAGADGGSAAPVSGAGAAAATGTVLKWSVAALATGIAIGGVAGRYGLRVEPIIIERVVVRTEQVRVEVPVPELPSAATSPAPSPPAPEPKVARAAPRPPEPVPEGANAERQLLEGARTALVRRDPASALQILGELRRKFAHGQLLEERDSLQVQALQQAGRDDEAREAAKAFLRQYPESVFGPAVESALMKEPPSPQ